MAEQMLSLPRTIDTRCMSGQLSIVEHLVLGSRLQFHNFIARSHNEIHVHIGARIFFIVKIKKDFPIHDAHADGRHKILDRRGTQCSGIDQPLQSQAERDECCSNGCGSRASIGLNHIAIDPNGTLAQPLQIGDSAQRAPDKALNLLGSATLLSFGRFPSGSRQSRARKHSILA